MAEHEVLIAGAGPAGIGASIWAHTLGLDYVVIDRAPVPGGQLHRIHNKIVDYPGLISRDGAQLLGHFLQHMATLGVRVLRDQEIVAVDLEQRRVETAGGDTLGARRLVLAMGVRRRRLGIPGEAELVGHGVCPSASKHAHEFRGQRVLVIGGGDAAFEEALILADVAEHVTLAHRSERFRARADFQQRVREQNNIDLLPNAEVVAIDGAGRVERVSVRSPDGHVSLPVGGVFICIGVEPNTGMIADQLDLDARGYIRVDARQQTSHAAVYAAGDICSGSSLTIAAALGQGAAAVKDIQRELLGDTA